MDNFRLDFENLEEIEKLMDPKAVQRALNSTIGRVSTKARTFASREARRTYNIKAGDLKRYTRIEKVRLPDGPGRIIEWKSRRLGLDKFSMGTRTVRMRVKPHKRKTPGGQASVKGYRAKRIAVTARVRKDSGRKIAEGAFPSGRIQGNKLAFERYSDRHDKIRRVVRLSVAQMVNEEILTRTARFVGTESNVELDRNLRFQLRKGA